MNHGQLIASVLVKELVMAKKESPQTERTNGKTTIAPRVLVTIARLSALSIDGVSRMAAVPGGVNRMFRRGVGEGVQIEIEDNRVTVDLFLVLDKGVSVREVCEDVQQAIARAINEMVGLKTKAVNVHIEEIEYPSSVAEE
jgi:uncharacterized alkaline shock family protein YloU